MPANELKTSRNLRSVTRQRSAGGLLSQGGFFKIVPGQALYEKLSDASLGQPENKGLLRNIEVNRNERANHTASRLSDREGDARRPSPSQHGAAGSRRGSRPATADAGGASSGDVVQPRRRSFRGRRPTRRHRLPSSLLRRHSDDVGFPRAIPPIHLGVIYVPTIRRRSERGRRRHHPSR